MMGTVFVTVGTTKFDELMQTVTRDNIKKVGGCNLDIMLGLSLQLREMHPSIQ